MTLALLSPSPPSSRYPSNFTNNVMIVAVAALFGTVILLAGFHIYARFFWWNRSGTERGRGRGARRGRRTYFSRFTIGHFFEHDWNGDSPDNHEQLGLDQSVVEGLPTFVFNSASSSSGHLECSVCLEDFTEGEKGRLLPKCSHCFHVDCIDMWFHSHATCPVCRCNVNPDPLEALYDALDTAHDPAARTPGSSNGRSPNDFRSRLGSSPRAAGNGPSTSGKKYIYRLGSLDREGADFTEIQIDDIAKHALSPSWKDRFLQSAGYTSPRNAVQRPRSSCVDIGVAGSDQLDLTGRSTGNIDQDERELAFEFPLPRSAGYESYEYSPNSPEIREYASPSPPSPEIRELHPQAPGTPPPASRQFPGDHTQVQQQHHA